MFDGSTATQVLILVCFGIFAASTMSASRSLFVTVLTISMLGLLRRVVNYFSVGPDPTFDPLVLVPLVGLAIGLAFAATDRDAGQTTVRPTAVKIGFAGVFLTLLGVGITVVASPSLPAFYYAALACIPLVAAVLIGRGSIADVWPAVENAVIAGAVLTGAYGLYQFFWLPPWDAEWMQKSNLTSIGLPYPTQVRAFGGLESPGPYSLLLLTAMLICVNRISTGKQGPRPLYLGLVTALLPALVVSSVRSALVALLVASFLTVALSARRAGGWVALAAAVPLFFFANKVLGSLSQYSSLFGGERFNASQIGSDTSVQARLQLLDRFTASTTGLIGNPSMLAADNFWISSAFGWGFFALLGTSLLALGAGTAAIQLLRSGPPGSAPTVVLGTLLMGIAGSFMTFSFAVVAGLAVGSTFRAIVARNASRTHPSTREHATQGR